MNGSTKNNFKKFIRKNYFFGLHHVINQCIGLINGYISSEIQKSELNDFCNTTFDDTEFSKVLNLSLGIETNDDYIDNKELFFINLINRFINVKKIKVPNNYIELIKLYYPTEKYLKKNDRKLISSILDSYGLKYKNIIKFCHQYENINLLNLIKIKKLLGDDFTKTFNRIDKKYFLLKTGHDPELKYHLKTISEQENKIILTDRQKELFIKILESDINRDIDYFLDDFKDHIKMVDDIRVFQPNFEMKSRNFIEYQLEHSSLTSIYRKIKKGFFIEYVFNDIMVIDVETPIISEKDGKVIMLYPKILKNEMDYTEESTFMHHCVSSYIDKNKSIIISLRTENKSDRVTSEFNVDNGNCLQSRHFCNQSPPEYFNSSLNILKNKIKKYSKEKLLESTMVNKIKIDELNKNFELETINY